MVDTPRLILFGRHACHLCDEMQAQLQPLQQAGQVQIELCDVDEREDWRRDYGSRVPVLMTTAGEVLSEYHLDPTRLDAWLDKNSA